jgi:hypothetical protein
MNPQDIPVWLKIIIIDTIIICVWIIVFIGFDAVFDKIFKRGKK